MCLFTAVKKTKASLQNIRTYKDFKEWGRLVI